MYTMYTRKRHRYQCQKWSTQLTMDWSIVDNVPEALIWFSCDQVYGQYIVLIINPYFLDWGVRQFLFTFIFDLWIANNPLPYFESSGFGVRLMHLETWLSQSQNRDDARGNLFFLPFAGHPTTHNPYYQQSQIFRQLIRFSISPFQRSHCHFLFFFHQPRVVWNNGGWVAWVTFHRPAFFGNHHLMGGGVENGHGLGRTGWWQC